MLVSTARNEEENLKVVSILLVMIIFIWNRGQEIRKSFYIYNISLQMKY